MTTRDKADLLDKLSYHEGCEQGEFWGTLVDMYCYRKDYMSEDFWLQVGLEIEVQFEDAVNYVMQGEMDVYDKDIMDKIKAYLKE